MLNLEVFKQDKKTTALMGALTVIAVLSVLLYLFYDLGPNPGFVFPRRRLRVISMVAVSIGVAYSSVIFQTITTMKIFTPSIIGFDALYMFIQSVFVMIGASGGYFITGAPNFLLSVGIMILFSLGLYGLIFRKGAQNIHFLLLSGMVLGTIFSSLTTFIQLMIDPDEFAILQNRIFINFNSINEPLIMIAGIVIVLALVAGIPYFKYLDVMALGHDASVALGAKHPYLTKYYLIIIAVLVSSSTALVGPATFLGLIVTNITYQLVRRHKHIQVIPVCMLISVISVVLGQFLVSRVFNLATNLSVIINFIGGLYFIYLLVFNSRERV